MIKVAIAGGTGYTAGELIRILLNHPHVEIVSILSTTSVGENISTVHRDLLGDTDIKFTDKLGDPDVLFLCLGHGLSKDFLDKNIISDTCKVIDLGNDFRLEPIYKGREFIYGLTDSFKTKIVNAKNIANPGCFATAIQSAVAPLAKAKLIHKKIHVTAITGSTGAGKKPSEAGHFSYRDNNISIYKLFSHQHIAEIKRSLAELTEADAPQINFVPMRGDFTRGIFASVYTKWSKGTEQEAINLYKEYYKDSPFVHISSSDISLKEVVNTNKVLIHIELHQGYIHIACIIDNLIKGAVGQAIENMNLMFNIEQTAGLKLKPSAF